MRRLLPFLVMIGLVPWNVAVGQSTPPGFAFYSDVCFNPEGGDLIGTRIGVMKLRDATYLFYQDAEGIFGQPQIVMLAPRALAGRKLSFQIADVNGPSTFVGTISDTMIQGRFTDGSVGPKGTGIYNLKRVALPEGRFPKCR
jgi:hypothetical protein